MSVVTAFRRNLYDQAFERSPFESCTRILFDRRFLEKREVRFVDRRRLFVADFPPPCPGFPHPPGHLRVHLLRVRDRGRWPHRCARRTGARAAELPADQRVRDAGVLDRGQLARARQLLHRHQGHHRLQPDRSVVAEPRQQDRPHPRADEARSGDLGGHLQHFQRVDLHCLVSGRDHQAPLVVLGPHHVGPGVRRAAAALLRTAAVVRRCV